MKVGRGNNTSRKQKHMFLSRSYNSFQLVISLTSSVPVPALWIIVMQIPAIVSFHLLHFHMSLKYKIFL